MTHFVILPAAEMDIRRAMDYYDDKRPGCGELFRLEVDRVFEMIRHWPEGYERIGSRLRRACLSRFDHAVIYRVFANSIRVVGVVGTRRDPSVIAELDEG